MKRLLIAFIQLLLTVPYAYAQTFNVGTATADITPCPPTPCGSEAIVLSASAVYPSGNGRGSQPALTVQSPLSVRALAVSDSTSGFIIVSLDTHSFTTAFADDLRAAIVQGTAEDGPPLAPENVIITATHTHTAPTLRSWCPGSGCGMWSGSAWVADDTNRCTEFHDSGSIEAEPDLEYVAAVRTRTIDTAVAAWSARQTASLYFGMAQTEIGAYRRQDGLYPYGGTMPVPEGAIRPQPVSVLEARNTSGTPIAILFSAAAHPIYWAFGDPDGNNVISSDFVGTARDQLSTSFPSATAIFLQGFAGDLNPNRTVVDIGELLATDVTTARTFMKQVTGAIRIRAQRHSVMLRTTSGSTCTTAAAQPTQLPVDKVVVEIGSGASGWNLAAISHEPILDLAAVERNSFQNPDRTMVIGYANGTSSYLPTEHIENYDYDATTGPAYEGHFSFPIYQMQRREGLWSNADVLSDESGFSGGFGSIALSGGGHVNIPAPSGSSLDLTGPVTVEGWIHAGNGSAAAQAIAERYASGGGGFALRLESGVATFYTVTNSQLWTRVAGTSALNDGQWHHVAGVYDGSDIRIYVDGVLENTTTGASAPASGSSDLRIGARADDSLIPFDGLIDEIRVTAGALYTSSFAPARRLSSVPGVRGLWKFDGNLLTDASIFGHDGVAAGTPTPTFDRQTAATAGSQSGTVLSLRATTAYIDVPSTDINLTPPFTVEAWVRPYAKAPSDATVQGGIVERYRSRTDGTVDGGFALRAGSSGTTGDNLLHFWVVQNGWSTTGKQQVVSSASLTPGIWQHVAAVVGAQSGGTYPVALYIQGQQTALSSVSIAPGSGAATLKIGARGDDAYASFIGEMHDVRISSAAMYSLSSGASFTPATTLSSGANTISLWHFDDGTTADAAGTNHGILMGGAALAAPATTSDALSLAGSGYVEVAPQSSVNITGAMTIEAWIKPTSVSSQQAIVEKYRWNGTSDDGGYAFRILAGGQLAFYTVRTSSDVSSVVSTTSVQAGTWQHVAAVYDGSSARLFIDGQPVSSSTSMSPAGIGSSTLKIGGRGDDGTTRFSGLIDDVRISSRARYALTSSFTPATALFSDGDVAGLWKFDAQTLLDLSGQRNDGAANGTVAYGTGH